MRLYYWKPSPWENFGDFLSIPILRALGFEPEPVVVGEPCLFAVGSILHPAHYSLCQGRPISVWGSGIGSNSPPPADTRFLAVRGPLTRDAFDLPNNIPLGDPALLLPRLMTLPSHAAKGEILFVNHCSADPPVCPPGFDTGVSTLIEASELLPLIARIADAKFVASESLHGCIVASAYGVPWAFTSIRWRYDFSSFTKITDWMCYLGLEPLRHAAANLTEARQWWERTGKHARLRDTTPLLDSLAKHLG